MSDNMNNSLGATEASVANIWESILGQRPSSSCNFFEIGGDSLLAAKLASQVKRQLNKRVRLMLIFENRVFADYAKAVHESPDASVSAPQASRSLL
jgi:yersiniabactin nonribosomal peptide/polyketide synthase